MRNDSRHHDTHEQLRAQCHHERSNVGRITRKVEANLSLLVTEALYGRVRQPRPDIKPMNVVSRIVLTIQRKPDRWDATQSHRIVHHVLLRDKRRCRVRPFRLRSFHPRRAPSQMLNRTVQLFAFVGPLHRRRAHVPTHTHELTNDQPSRLFALHHFPQTPARQHARALYSPTQAPHNVPVHRETLPGGLSHKHRVHQSPDQSVATLPVHYAPRDQPQQVLHSFRWQNLPRATIVIQVTNPHGKLQRKRFREPTRLSRHRGLVRSTWPAVRHALRSPQVLVFVSYLTSRIKVHGAAILQHHRVRAHTAQLLQHLFCKHLHGRGPLRHVEVLSESERAAHTLTIH